MTLWLLHDPNVVSDDEALAHAQERGFDLVAHGIPPWMEGTGAVTAFGADGYNAIKECDLHPYQVLTVVGHGDAWKKDLDLIVCDWPPPVPDPLADLPEPFIQALPYILPAWQEATNGGATPLGSGATLSLGPVTLTATDTGNATTVG